MRRARAQHVTGVADPSGGPPPHGGLSNSTGAGALRPLGGVTFGRVFTHAAPPTIRPVNHLLDRGHVIFRTHPGAATTTVGDGVVVAYQADNLDPATHPGCSVVVAGRAWAGHRPAGPPARYQKRPHPWIGTPMNQAIRISTDLVTGFALRPTRHPLPVPDTG